MSAASLPRSFLDTNILIYADDKRNPGKQAKAIEIISELMRQRAGVVSMQVLQEYFSAVTRKLSVDAAIARRKIEFFAQFDVAEPKVTDLLTAIDLHRIHGLAFWDALIVHAAQQSDCRILYSEDMQHNRLIDKVEIVNPFL